MVGIPVSFILQIHKKMNINHGHSFKDKGSFRNFNWDWNDKVEVIEETQVILFK